MRKLNLCTEEVEILTEMDNSLYIDSVQVGNNRQLEVIASFDNLNEHVYVYDLDSKEVIISGNINTHFVMAMTSLHEA